MFRAGPLMEPLGNQPILINQVHQRLLTAIVDGTLPAGHRIRQGELAEMLGVSRQPISHALQLLRRERLLEQSGKRGLIVAHVEAARINDLYQVRTVIEQLAARLAAERVARKAAAAAEVDAVRTALAAGQELGPEAGVGSYIEADVAFHSAIYRLSGNSAVEETVAAQWPHLKRSMGMVLADAAGRPVIWAEHAAILFAILAGDGDRAAEAARRHTDRARNETVLRLSRRTAA